MINSKKELIEQFPAIANKPITVLKTLKPFGYYKYRWFFEVDDTLLFGMLSAFSQTDRWHNQEVVTMPAFQIGKSFAVANFPYKNKIRDIEQVRIRRKNWSKLIAFKESAIANKFLEQCAQYIKEIEFLPECIGQYECSVSKSVLKEYKYKIFLDTMQPYTKERAEWLLTTIETYQDQLRIPKTLQTTLNQLHQRVKSTNPRSIIWYNNFNSSSYLYSKISDFLIEDQLLHDKKPIFYRYETLIPTNRSKR